jgi:hypothetical protein
MIRIDQPCPEKWENMLPSAGGNYCGICCKTVVDFSERSNEEIVDYFSANTGKRICGRFKTEQVIRPKVKFTLTRFLAAVVLVFGSLLFIGCGNTNERHDKNDSDHLIIGDSLVMTPRVDSIRRADSIRVDSIIKAANEKMHEDSLHKK